MDAIQSTLWIKRGLLRARLRRTRSWGLSDRRRRGLLRRRQRRGRFPRLRSNCLGDAQLLRVWGVRYHANHSRRPLVLLSGRNGKRGPISLIQPILQTLDVLRAGELFPPQPRGTTEVERLRG
jgi:hypothetical protein